MTTITDIKEGDRLLLTHTRFPDTQVTGFAYMLVENDAVYILGLGWATETDWSFETLSHERPEREALVQWMHSRQEFEYDKCDHGVYTGGAMHGQPYAMCERWADAFLTANLVFARKEV